jgi:hypothetical protein
MRVLGLDGRRYPWRLVGRRPTAADPVGRSTPHLRARRLLRAEFPLELVLEEVPLPGSGGLRGDFVVPRRRLAVEAHGSQHYEFNAFFHDTRAAFRRGQANDARKAQWYELNGFTLVTFPHDESDDEWRARLRAALGG